MDPNRVFDCILDAYELYGAPGAAQDKGAAAAPRTLSSATASIDPASEEVGAAFLRTFLLSPTLYSPSKLVQLLGFKFGQYRSAPSSGAAADKEAPNKDSKYSSKDAKDARAAAAVSKDAKEEKPATPASLYRTAAMLVAGASANLLKLRLSL